ncbi:hypothetical protein VOLCADRAFT_120362, partial [Volvox carteri f. nagariensis]
MFALDRFGFDTRCDAFDVRQVPVEIDVEALQKRLEARAKAMIQLEEQEVASRTKVKFVLKQKIGLGECWKVVGRCPELGNMLPEVAPYMQWNNGDVWTYEAKIRPGTFQFKAVLRKPDGQYLWEDGKERIIEVPFGEPADLEIQITDVKFKRRTFNESTSINMLKEVQPNSYLSRCTTVNSDKVSAPKSGPENSLLAAASSMRLPNSEDELEDYSSSSSSSSSSLSEDGPSVPRSIPRRRLVRLDKSRSAANEQPVDDLLKGIASLDLRPAATQRAGRPSAAPNGSAVHAMPGSSPSNVAPPQAPSEASGDSDTSESDSDKDVAPFYERLVPSLGAKATAAKATSSAPPKPEPGSLVLGEDQQYVLGAHVAQKLYPHQVQGVKWLWNLFSMQRGGILGDDMGLGKTMQISAFLAGLFGSQLVRRAIIIAPKTLLPHWIKELTVCGLRNLTHEFFGNSESERSAALRGVVSGRGVIVTTYGMVQHNSEQLARPAHSSRDHAFTWDVMLLDEGHKIKNPKMKLVEHLNKLPARVRVIISGTPIQNNLMEMHSLFDFTTTGLLGDAKTFKKNYERPITKGLDKEATARERQTGAAIAAELRQRVEPYFLRREKKDVLRNDSSSSSNDVGGRGDATSESGPSSSSGSAAGVAPQVGQRARGLPRKNDMRKIYTAFLHTDSVRQVLNEKASPLAAITVLKKICDHPALLSQRAANNVIKGAHRWAKHGGSQRREMDDFIVYSDEDIVDSSDSDDAEGGKHGDGEPPAGWLEDGAGLDTELARELEQRGAEASCKSAFVLALLGRLHAEGHRTLIFSQSKVMLSILEAGVKAMKLSYCRIDGDVASAEERQAHVQRFQNSNIPVFLLTSQVGGLGLTLTAADRVIIVDPAWNPSVDDQSVDRAYRMGQTRDVVVYRLITCGTVEEKIYRRQVFKGGLSKTGTEEGIQFRYFTQTELRDLFSVTTEGLQQSVTQSQLHEMHGHQRDASEDVRRHLEQVRRMDSVAGIHDHNLLFTRRPDEHVPSAQEGRAILNQMTGSGPVGLDALTAKLGSGLKLDSRVEDTKRQAQINELRNEVVKSKNAIANYESFISSGKAGAMPDRGAKVRAVLQEVRTKLEAQLAQLAALEGRNVDAATPDAGTGPDTGGTRTLPAAVLVTAAQGAASGPHLSQPQSERPPGPTLGGRRFGAGLRSRSLGNGDSTKSESALQATGQDQPHKQQSAGMPCSSRDPVNGAVK